MSPITKRLAAGSIAVASIFALNEAFDFTSLLHKAAPHKQAIEAANLPKVSVTVEKVNPSPTIVKTEETTTAAVAATTEAVETSTNTYTLKHAAVHPYTPVSFRNKIDVARLARKMSRTISTRHLQLAPVTINTPAEETVAVAETAVNQAVAMASVEEQQKTTGGSAYHSTAKETKSPTDISSFSAIRQPDKGADSYSYATIYNGTEALRDLAVRNGNNTDYAIMVNLGIKTGKKRFFLVDLTSNTIIKSGIVAEGSGDMTAVAEKKYSNDLGSTSTALGVYSIGKRTSKDAYRLQGLQETNSTKR